YCLKIQPATGSFARNLIYSTKPFMSYNFVQSESHGCPWLFVDVVTVWTLFDKNPFLSVGWLAP
ncbi:hypothetical protein, partial [Klebsiella quasipneumoniae]|uniref:hypothetical protein n=1 Tax=Klebsiella quasipneumoniae TaxID=1463165 RepID=UPI001BA548F0